MGLRTRFLRTLGLQRVPREQPRRRRSYAGAIVSRLTSDWMSTQASADAEIRTSIKKLRDRSREMVRNNPYAKQAKRTTQVNVVGSGIKLSLKFSRFGVGSLVKRLIASLKRSGIYGPVPSIATLPVGTAST